MTWVLCPDGCGLHHKEGDQRPAHDASWLERERERLTREVATFRGPGVIGSHWIRPSPLVANRPRNAVTSAEPPPIDELAAARERREVLDALGLTTPSAPPKMGPPDGPQ